MRTPGPRGRPTTSADGPPVAQVGKPAASNKRYFRYDQFSSIRKGMLVLSFGNFGDYKILRMNDCSVSIGNRHGGIFWT